MSNTSQTTAKSNGSAKKPTKQVIEKAAKPKAEKTFSLEEIEKRNEFLNSLFEKRDRLLSSQLKLQKFQMGSDDFSTTLQFSDRHGSTFSTMNRDTIARTVKMIDDDIKNAMIEVEAHIKSIFD